MNSLAPWHLSLITKPLYAKHKDSNSSAVHQNIRTNAFLDTGSRVQFIAYL